MFCDPVWQDQGQLAERFSKTLYLGPSKKSSNRPPASLSLTEITVRMIRQSIARQELAALDVNFAANLIHRAWISPASIILAMMYLDKLKAKHSDFLRQNGSQELFLISVAVATKFLYDKGEEEAMYDDDLCKIVDMDMADIVRTELDFLNAMEWSLFVRNQEFLGNLLKFEAMVTINELKKRRTLNNDHPTYTEMLTLFEYVGLNTNEKLASMIRDLTDLTKGFVMCVTAYCAALAMLTASLTVMLSLHATIQTTLQIRGPSSDLSLLASSQPHHSDPSQLASLDLSCQPTSNHTLDLCEIDLITQNHRIQSQARQRALRKLILDLDAFPTQDELLGSLGTRTSEVHLVVRKPYRYVKQFR